MLPAFLGRRPLATLSTLRRGVRRGLDTARRRNGQTARAAPEARFAAPLAALPPGPGQVYAWRIAETDATNATALEPPGLRFDAAQARALASLDRLHARLHDYGAARLAHEDKLEARVRRIRGTCADEGVAVLHTGAAAAAAGGTGEDAEKKRAEGVASALRFAQTFARRPGDLQRSGAVRVPRGLYLHGEVGTGKSLCMDLLYETSSIPRERKRRLHFHDFMAEAHRRVHEWKMKQPALTGKEALAHVQSHRHRRSGKIIIAPEADALVSVARDMADEAWLLCFDEFQVTDVADALIMSKLFGTMWACGTVVVATSNRAPDGLYENGLNRHYFLPFIAALERRCKLHGMDSHCDHRLLTHADEALSCYILDDSSKPPGEAAAALDAAFRAACEDERSAGSADMSGKSVAQDAGGGETGCIIMPTAFGRSMEIPREDVCGGVVRFDFESLCKTDLGASDYHAIARRFHTIVIRQVPQLDRRLHNEARRFIMLVDQLYENKVRLFCSAATTPLDLFRQRGGDEDEDASEGSEGRAVGATGEEDDPYGREISSNNVRVEELAAVQELHFAFQRASSRLVEMMSREYLTAHSRKRSSLVASPANSST